MTDSRNQEDRPLDAFYDELDAEWAAGRQELAEVFGAENPDPVGADPVRTGGEIPQVDQPVPGSDADAAERDRFFDDAMYAPSSAVSGRLRATIAENRDPDPAAAVTSQPTPANDERPSSDTAPGEAAPVAIPPRPREIAPVRRPQVEASRPAPQLAAPVRRPEVEAGPASEAGSRRPIVLGPVEERAASPTGAIVLGPTASTAPVGPAELTGAAAAGLAAAGLESTPPRTVAGAANEVAAGLVGAAAAGLAAAGLTVGHDENTSAQSPAPGPKGDTDQPEAGLARQPQAGSAKPDASAGAGDAAQPSGDPAPVDADVTPADDAAQAGSDSSGSDVSVDPDAIAPAGHAGPGKAPSGPSPDDTRAAEPQAPGSEEQPDPGAEADPESTDQSAEAVQTAETGSEDHADVSISGEQPVLRGAAAAGLAAAGISLSGKGREDPRPEAAEEPPREALTGAAAAGIAAAELTKAEQSAQPGDDQNTTAEAGQAPEVTEDAEDEPATSQITPAGPSDDEQAPGAEDDPYDLVLDDQSEQTSESPEPAAQLTEAAAAEMITAESQDPGLVEAPSDPGSATRSTRLPGSRWEAPSDPDSAVSNAPGTDQAGTDRGDDDLPQADEPSPGPELTGAAAAGLAAARIATGPTPQRRPEVPPEPGITEGDPIYTLSGEEVPPEPGITDQVPTDTSQVSDQSSEQPADADSASDAAGDDHDTTNPIATTREQAPEPTAPEPGQTPHQGRLTGAAAAGLAAAGPALAAAQPGKAETFEPVEAPDEPGTPTPPTAEPAHLDGPSLDQAAEIPAPQPVPEPPTTQAAPAETPAPTQLTDQTAETPAPAPMTKATEAASQPPQTATAEPVAAAETSPGQGQPEKVPTGSYGRPKPNRRRRRQVQEDDLTVVVDHWPYVPPAAFQAAAQAQSQLQEQGLAKPDDASPFGTGQPEPVSRPSVAPVAPIYSPTGGVRGTWASLRHASKPVADVDATHAQLEDIDLAGLTAGIGLTTASERTDGPPVNAEPSGPVRPQPEVTQEPPADQTAAQPSEQAIHHADEVAPPPQAEPPTQAVPALTPQPDQAAAQPNPAPSQPAPHPEPPAQPMAPAPDPAALSADQEPTEKLWATGEPATGATPVPDLPEHVMFEESPSPEPWPASLTESAPAEPTPDLDTAHDLAPVSAADLAPAVPVRGGWFEKARARIADLFEEEAEAPVSETSSTPDPQTPRT